MSEMENNLGTLHLTRRKKILFFGIYLLVLAVFVIITLEIILRLKGLQSWQKFEIHIKVSPGETLYTKHPTLGYANIPGEFTIILANGYSFKATNLPNTLRVTHPLSTYGAPGQKEEIWIFGCSCAYGWSLNDQETFPWLLQEKFPEYEVVNYGVNGYGTVQSLIQFREALARGRVPKMVVLAFASWHDDRNIFSRNWRKIIIANNKLGQLVYPYARLDRDGKLNYYLGKVEFNEFPLMEYSAFMHYIELGYNKMEERFWQIREVTKGLILEFANTAKKQQISLVVAGITQSQPTRDMLSFVRENGFKAVDMSVDLSIKENINPNDGHPSASANQKYADKLEAFLRTEVLK